MSGKRHMWDRRDRRETERERHTDREREGERDRKRVENYNTTPFSYPFYIFGLDKGLFTEKSPVSWNPRHTDNGSSIPYCMLYPIFYAYMFLSVTVTKRFTIFPASVVFVHCLLKTSWDNTICINTYQSVFSSKIDRTSAIFWTRDTMSCVWCNCVQRSSPESSTPLLLLMGKTHLFKCFSWRGAEFHYKGNQVNRWHTLFCNIHLCINM